MVIDEIHTPDSSRFWKADTYPKASLQMKNQRISIKSSSGWNTRRGFRRDGEPPVMPDQLWAAAASVTYRYTKRSPEYL